MRGFLFPGIIFLFITENARMKLGDRLLLLLKKKYEISSFITMRYKGNDLSFKTDEHGNPILLFIGKMNEEGIVKGDRYARRLITDKNGIVIKDHWDYKGKAT